MWLWGATLSCHSVWLPLWGAALRAKCNFEYSHFTSVMNWSWTKWKCELHEYIISQCLLHQLHPTIIAHPYVNEMWPIRYNTWPQLSGYRKKIYCKLQLKGLFISIICRLRHPSCLLSVPSCMKMQDFVMFTYCGHSFPCQPQNNYTLPLQQPIDHLH